MSLLSAARAIAATEPLEEYGGVYSCVYCRACRHSNQAFAPVSQHANDCPWLAMPKIVAALECVYGLMQSENGAEPIEGDDFYGYRWAFCQRSVDEPHWDGCLWVKLRDLVYRGEST
jgi:hypothetical protein